MKKHTFNNPLSDLAGYQLRRASATILADLAHELDDLRLRPTEASVLVLIDANPDITQSDIGRILAIKRANMAPITATLTERDLIDRTQADGRSQALRLSPKGAKLARQILRRFEIHEARFFQDLSAAERRRLIDVLRSAWDKTSTQSRKRRVKAPASGA